MREKTEKWKTDNCDLEAEAVVRGRAIYAIEIKALVVGERDAITEKRLNKIAGLGTNAARGHGGVGAIIFVAVGAASRVMQIR